MEFGIFIRNKREEAGLSTRELSKRIGKSSNYISSLENGRTKLPSPSVAKLLLEELSVEHIENVMIEYGIIEKNERLRVLFNMDEESKKQEFIDAIYESIEEMDMELVSALYAMVKRHKDVIRNVSILESTSKRSLNSLKDYLNFLVNK